MADNRFDLVVLGGGSGGYAAALRAAELGRSVVLVEKDKVGGTCLHRGCIPTKALLHAGEIADQARESATFGVKTTFDGMDMPGVHKYKDSVIAKNHKGLTGLIKGRGIQIVAGEGRLTGPKTVQVGADVFTGTNVVLATGSHSRTLPGLDLDGGRVMASEHALELDRVPATAIVLGGGVIGCEFASAWTSFGSRVTIVEALPHLVPLEEEASSKLLEREFRRRGIGIQLSARFERAEPAEDGVRVHLEGGDTLDAELLLVAVGRGPASAGLGYESHGVGVERGFVTVDEYCRTSAPGVYAVGDLVSVRRRRAPATGPRRLRRGHPGRRAYGRVAGGAHRLRGRAAHHLQPPRGRVGRLHLAQAAGRYGPDAITSVSTTCPVTVAVRSCPPGARSR